MTIKDKQTEKAAEKLTAKLERLGLKHEINWQQEQLLQFFIDNCNAVRWRKMAFTEFVTAANNGFGNWRALFDSVKVLERKQLICLKLDEISIEFRINAKLAAA